MCIMVTLNGSIISLSEQRVVRSLDDWRFFKPSKKIKESGVSRLAKGVPEQLSVLRSAQLNNMRPHSFNILLKNRKTKIKVFGVPAMFENERYEDEYQNEPTVNEVELALFLPISEFRNQIKFLKIFQDFPNFGHSSILDFIRQVELLIQSEDPEIDVGRGCLVTT